MYEVSMNGDDYWQVNWITYYWITSDKAGRRNRDSHAIYEPLEKLTPVPVSGTGVMKAISRAFQVDYLLIRISEARDWGPIE